MACARNNQLVGVVGTKNGITANASQSASLAPKEFDFLTYSKLVNRSKQGTLEDQSVSPQAKWTRLDRMYRLSNPQVTKTEMKQFQAWRRRLVASNVKQFHNAIKQQCKVDLQYLDASSAKRERVIPLDVRAGLSPGTKHNRYMWGYSEESRLRRPYPVSEILRVELTDEEFDLKEAIQISGKKNQKEFILPRDWSKRSPDTLRIQDEQPKQDEQSSSKVGPGANLKGTDLAGIDLSGHDLSGADMSGANLSHANLRSVNLRGANLSEADLGNASLSFAKCNRADLQRATLFEAKLDGANLTGANLSGSSMVDVFALEAQMPGANLSRANLTTAELHSVNLEGANLREANLWGADLSGAILKKADLRDADLQFTSLQDADLRGAKLSGAKFNGADLTGCKLTKTQRSQVGLNKFAEVFALPEMPDIIGVPDMVPA